MDGKGWGPVKIGVVKETAERETRVALAPVSAARFTRGGIDVLVETGAGGLAFFTDEAYREAGAEIAPDAANVYANADVIVKVAAPSVEETGVLRDGQILVAVLQPLTSHELVGALAERGVTAFSLDAIPRIARAQPMDVLSSQASIAGYKAVLIAADTLGKHLPMMTTAAGTMPPARGLVLGAGVAGLQAIATGRRLGAVMSAFDVRPAVKEQVQSLGATFIEDEELQRAQAETAGGYAREQTADERERSQALVRRHVGASDFVITTALVPGRPAPKLITREMVEDMAAGSVIVDLAAETGGNCELTAPGETIVHEGVIINGPINVPSSLPVHASLMFSRNAQSFLDLLVKDGEVVVDLEDVIVRDSLITRGGEITHDATREAMKGAAA